MQIQIPQKRRFCRKSRKIPKNRNFILSRLGELLNTLRKCTPGGPPGRPGGPGGPPGPPRGPIPPSEPPKCPGVPPKPSEGFGRVPRVESRLHGVRLRQSSQLARVWSRDSCSAISSPRSRYLAWKGGRRSVYAPSPPTPPAGGCVDRRLRLWPCMVLHLRCTSLTEGKRRGGTPADAAGYSPLVFPHEWFDFDAPSRG